MADYRRTYISNHPLSPPHNSYVYEHRLVLWGKIGPGTHPCHHCGCSVTWAPGRGLKKGSLVVDHLDDNTQNNDPANLVPSCHPCNKGRQPRIDRIRDDELSVPMTGSSFRTRAIEIHCEECQKVFLAAPTRRQRFCSRQCSSRNVRRAVLARGGGRRISLATKSQVDLVP